MKQASRKEIAWITFCYQLLICRSFCVFSRNIRVRSSQIFVCMKLLVNCIVSFLFKDRLILLLWLPWNQPYVDQADWNTEMCLPLLPKCWNQRLSPLCLSAIKIFLNNLKIEAKKMAQ